MSQYRFYTDEQLYEEVRHGNHGAFKALYDRYWETLWRYVASTTHPDDAKDIIQDVFTSIWLKRNDLTFRHSFRAYLYRATLNKVIDRSTRARYADQYIASLAKTYEEGHYTTDYFVFEKELIQRFEACLEKMPPKMRIIFELSRTDMLSHQEISERLHISRDNVNRQIKNALIRLKKSLLFIFLFFFLP